MKHLNPCKMGARSVFAQIRGHYPASPNAENKTAVETRTRSQNLDYITRKSLICHLRCTDTVIYMRICIYYARRIYLYPSVSNICFIWNPNKSLRLWPSGYGVGPRIRLSWVRTSSRTIFFCARYFLITIFIIFSTSSSNLISSQSRNLGGSSGHKR